MSFWITGISLDPEELFDSVNALAHPDALEFITETLGEGKVVVLESRPDLDESTVFLSAEHVVRLLEATRGKDGTAADIRDSLTRVYMPLAS